MTILWAGLSVGAIYALVALGYNLVFSASGAFNFAHAQLLMLGVFISYWSIVTLKLPVGVAFVLAAVIVGVVAAVEERVAIRPVASIDGQLVTTVGVATMLNGACQLIWGNQALQVPFLTDNSSLTLFGGRLEPVDISLIVAALLLVAAVVVLSRRTTLGLALLAVAEDREAASLRGISVRAVALGAFVVAGVLAGLAGPLVGPKTFAVATLGTSLALKGFVALSIGGFGSYAGGLVGGLAIGVVEAEAGFYLGNNYSDIAVFAVLMIVLLVRPAGLFISARERVV